MMESEGGIDRISNLPVNLLSDILSLLPTKTAIATSVLSTRWKLLWTSITNVDLNIDEVPAWEGNELEMWRIKYTHYVNMVLRLLDPPRIQNFRLQCYHELIDPSCLNSWISFALGRTVRELDLLLVMEEHVALPLSLIYCNLVVLKLEGGILLNIPATASVCFPSLQTLLLRGVTFPIATDTFISFPSLKIMWLDDVKYADEDSIHKLFSSCPILDDLFIRRASLDNLLCLIIRIPSLTRLTLMFENLDDFACKVQLDTPALEYLNLNDNLPCEYLPAENLYSLVQAKVRVDFKCDDEVNVERCIDIVKFIGSLSKVKFLLVSGCAFTAIRRTVSANIPLCFHNLSRLELELHYCPDLSVMISLLENMDNLEHLVFKGYWYHWCLRYFESWWTEPLNVPNCLMCRVTTISFTGFVDECRNQLSLLRYLLKNAKVLQLLTLRFGARTYPETRKLERRLEKISMFPRGSETCQVKFHVESPYPDYESDSEQGY